MRACRAFSDGAEEWVSSSSEVGMGEEDVSAGTEVLRDTSGGLRRLVLSSVLLLDKSSLRRGLLGLLLFPGTAPRGVEGPGKGRRVILGVKGVGGDRGRLFSTSLPLLLFFIRRVSLGRGEAYSSLRLSRSWSGRGDL
jgi:hypothetical protein